MKGFNIASIPTLDYDVGFHESSSLDSTIDPVTVAIAVAVFALLHSRPAR
jgi:hypothetical protein